MAVPNPERELQRLQKNLKQKGGPPSLIVVAGPSAFFRNEALEAAIAKIPASADIRRIDGSEHGDGRELDDLRGGSLFGSGTWVVVRRGDAWFKEHGAALAGMLDGIAAGCGLVLEVQKIDRRTKLGKALVERQSVFEFRDPYAEPYDRTRSPLEAELIGWVCQRGKQVGVELLPEAAFLVVTTVGRDPAELVAELHRLAGALNGERRTLSADDLRPHLHTSFESTPFEFADAVLAFDRARAMRSLDAMFSRGVRSRDGSTMDQGGVFPFVLSWLWQSFANVLQGRTLVDGGVRASDAAGRVGVRTFADRFRAQVEGNPAGRLRRGLRLLLSAQRELRSTGEEPRWLLERFLARYFREDVA
jgi:DNA polymerase III delta subunit